MPKIIALEFNELNFEFIDFFAKRGALPNLRNAIARNGLIRTEAEQAQHLLEPWIQWPTVYCGKNYAEHGIFRLGDSISSPHIQIWEMLESRGLTVGAISPMNAVNRCMAPAFFLSDPWTDTPAHATPAVLALHGCIRAMVNNNAADNSGILSSVLKLLPLAAPHISLRSAPEYLRLSRIARHGKWAKAAILDRLLADLFLSLSRKSAPDYCSLFLNGAAHIQHHHMFDSQAYAGEKRNPEWYSRARSGRIDPLLEVYRTYDRILGDLLRLDGYRVLITTGLSQIANPRDHFQYRLTDAAKTLRRLGLRDFEVQMRMSRDFLLLFSDPLRAQEAQSQLQSLRCAGHPLFAIDNRGASLFCQVAYHGAPAGLQIAGRERGIEGLENDFVLVSIENGIHCSVGYHIDTGADRIDAVAQETIPLASLFERIAALALAGKDSGLSRGTRATASNVAAAA